MANTDDGRKLKSRHLQMIAIGSAIGTGLFVSSGEVLKIGGPLGALFSYMLAGVIVYFVMTSLGEMSAVYPVSGSFSTFANKFVDPAWGFAMGWNYYLIYAVAIPAEVLACAHILQFWWPNVPTWILIAANLAFMIGINMFGVRWFGEVEFVLSMIKVVVICIFIITGIAIVFKDNLGFSAYSQGGGPFGSQGLTGFFTVVATAFFAFNGTELVGVTAGEAENPEKSIPAAIKSTFWRITIFYTLTIFIIGLIIPQTNPALGLGGVSASPFVLTMDRINVHWATDALNAVIFVAVLSAGNSCVYGTSRILMGLADANHAPKVFLEQTSTGVPLYSLLLSLLIGSIAFISIIPGYEDMISILMSLVGMQIMITYAGICGVHIRFRQAFKAQGHALAELPYVAPFAPYGQIIGISLIVFLLLGMVGTDFLQGKMSLIHFVKTYFGAPVYFSVYFAYKLIMKTRLIPLLEVDLTSKSIKDGMFDSKSNSKYYDEKNEYLDAIKVE